MTERSGTEKQGDGTDEGQRKRNRKTRVTTRQGQRGRAEMQRDREEGIKRMMGDRVTHWKGTDTKGQRWGTKTG